MADEVQFVLVGNDVPALEGLAQCVQTLGLNVTVETIISAERSIFDGRHIVIVDIDCDRGLQVCYRIASEYPTCLVATLSENNRPADRTMHILKPLGYIDIQILLIRAGAVSIE